MHNVWRAAMPPPIAIDLTCLLLSALQASPRGIDRVELAYGKHVLIDRGGPCFPILPTPWGVRFFDRDQALRGIEKLEQIWGEENDPDQDAAYVALRQTLNGLASSAAPTATSRLSYIERAKRIFEIFAATGIGLGRSAANALPRGTVYLNVGQLLFLTSSLNWLSRRPDVLSVMMLHDLIPLDLPALHVPLGVRLHRSILKNVDRFADAIIVPSDTIRNSLVQANASLARKTIHTELLPVGDAFLGACGRDPSLDTTNYFLACGVIEAHKNHLVLLQAWELLCAKLGEAAPTLVIAGRPSPTSHFVFDFVQEHPTVRRKTHIVSGLSTPALRQLMMSAKAVLMPSLAEGFGLPIVEGLAQGTPVLASDIPAHREAGGNYVRAYIDPRQPKAWADEILRVVQEGSPGRPAYRPKEWADYFKGIEMFLDTLRKPGG